MVDFVALGLVACLVLGVFDAFLEGVGTARPTELALILILIRIHQILTYIAKNSDDIKELLIEDEDEMREVMYHPPYEVEE